MAETAQWRKRGAWDGIAVPALLNVEKTAGVSIAPRENASVATIIGREGETAALKNYFFRECDLELPPAGKCASGKDIELAWSGPSQWLAVSRDARMVVKLISALKSIAAVTDQSDSRAILRLSGPRVRDALAKGCLVDLHPHRFGPGSTITTTIGGIGTQIWWVNFDSAPYVAVPRSMARSFWSWLVQSAAEYGVEVSAPLE